MRKGAACMEKITGLINNIFLFAAILCVMILLISCSWQVITRYFLGHAAGWTEEVARYSFIWGNMLGAAACVRLRNHANVSILHDLLPVGPRRWQSYCIHILFALFGLLMIYVGYWTVLAQMGRNSAITKIPMALVYTSVVISGAGIDIQSLNNLIQDFVHRNDAEYATADIPQEVRDAIELSGKGEA